MRIPFLFIVSSRYVRVPDPRQASAPVFSAFDPKNPEAIQRKVA